MLTAIKTVFNSVAVYIYNDKYFVKVTFFPSLYLTCPSITGLSSPIFRRQYSSLRGVLRDFKQIQFRDVF